MSIDLVFYLRPNNFKSHDSSCFPRLKSSRNFPFSCTRNSLGKRKELFTLRCPTNRHSMLDGDVTAIKLSTRIGSVVNALYNQQWTTNTAHNIHRQRMCISFKQFLCLFSVFCILFSVLIFCNYSKFCKVRSF